MRPASGIHGWEYLGTHLGEVEGRTPLEILDDAFERSEVDGNASFKLMWPQLAALRARSADRGQREELEAELKRVPWIRLRRRDRVAQAVSWAKAVQSQQWNSRNQAQATSIQYNYVLIWRLLFKARRYEREWDRWFDALQIEPLELVYEDYVQDLPGTVRRIARHLGRDGDLVCRREETNLEVQRNVENRVWKERFLREHRSAPARIAAMTRSAASRSTWRVLWRSS